MHACCITCLDQSCTLWRMIVAQSNHVHLVDFVIKFESHIWTSHILPALKRWTRARSRALCSMDRPLSCPGGINPDAASVAQSLDPCYRVSLYLEGCKGHAHKGHREKVLKVMNFRDFQGVFSVFSGIFRVFFSMPFPGLPFGPFQYTPLCFIFLESQGIGPTPLNSVSQPYEAESKEVLHSSCPLEGIAL